MLKNQETALLVVDVQEKLFAKMHEREALGQNITRFIQGGLALGLPVVWAEQYPEGMGPTVAPVADLLRPLAPIPKKTFSLCRLPALMEAIEKTGRKRFLLVGIETHVCIYQTAIDLLQLGYQADVVTDCVSSRTAANHALALNRIQQAGGHLTSLEMALFELLRSADHPQFKQILSVVK